MTFLGRFTNFMARRLRPIWRLTWLGHSWAYRRTGGRRFRRLMGTETFSLTVRGRKTGEPRSVMLILTRRGEDLVVCGSHAGHPSTPNWYRNLVAASEAEVMVAGDRWSVRAREVDGAERDECWKLPVGGFRHFEAYQSLTDRRLPVAVLEPV